MIRPISEIDVNSVFSLMKLNMEHYYSQRNEEWNEAKIRDHFLSQDGVVIHKEGEVAGFSFYELKKDRIHIHTLQISPQYQNRTLGGSLFKWYEKLALEVNAKELTCGVYENNPAREIYLKLGFNEIGIVDGVVRMSLPLTSICTGSLLRSSSVS
jgi:ribosomal protein S18 acetylase RimI-like enzyme